LKDSQTKNAFTSALAKKVAKISHTFSQLTTQLRSSNTTPQSFADTTNAALSDILQHAAHVVLGKVDPHTSNNVPEKFTAHHTANHHSSQNPQEAYLQSTIQHHWNAIHTLEKDLSLDDPDTLTFHRDKLKEAQDALDKLRKTKKQDKLLCTVTQDVAHDVGPADHLHNSMWDYLKKYKNDHTTPSLPQTTRYVYWQSEAPCLHPPCQHLHLTCKEGRQIGFEITSLCISRQTNLDNRTPYQLALL